MKVIVVMHLKSGSVRTMVRTAARSLVLTQMTSLKMLSATHFVSSRAVEPTQIY